MAFVVFLVRAADKVHLLDRLLDELKHVHVIPFAAAVHPARMLRHSLILSGLHNRDRDGFIVGNMIVVVPDIDETQKELERE